MTNQTQDIPSFLLAPQQEHAFARGDGGASQAVAPFATDVSADALRAALTTVVARHEILRTTFVRPAGLRVPQQVIHDELAPSWGESVGEPLEALLAAAAAALDPEHGPVLRACLAELPTGRALVLSGAAACVDRQSLLLVLSELSALVAGADPGDEPLQYADYAEWRRQSAEEDAAASASAHDWWQGGAPAFDRPLLFGGRGEGTEAERISFDLGGAVSDVHAAAERARVTTAVFLEASLHALVARLSGETELTLAGLADGRAQPDLAGAVGPYAQFVPIRSRIDDGTTFAELVDQIGRGRADAARWQDFASAQELASAAGAGVAFAFVDEPLSPGVFDTSPAALRTARSTPLELAVWGDAPSLELVFDPSAYTSDDVRRIADSYTALVTGAARDAAIRVADLPLLSAEERDAVLALADGGDGAVTTTTFVQEFQARAASAPSVGAVSDGTTTLTYAELNVAANRLAHELAGAGVARGASVGLFLDRTTDALVALLGILKAGAAFVPLNVEHPASRLAHQLTEAEVAVVVTRSEFLHRLPETPAPVVCLDRDADALAARPDTDPVTDVTADDVAYVMYTSGSTGLPKGVAVTHANVANYTARMLDRFGDVAGATFAVVSALSTDLGYTSVFPPLAGGGSVQLVPADVVLDPEAFAAHAADAGIDVLKITPSLLGALLAGRGGDVLPRRWLVCGGEAFTHDLLARIRATGARCRILNHYGPTETTIGTCALEVTDDLDESAASVPVGRPFANARAYVVDASGEPVPPGVAGELLIGGAGVARGYVNRPDETAERFVADPFAPGRVYRTGDRVRMLRGGAIEFLGRIDQQVKIRGYRVEPGEVEAALLRHDAVKGAAVVVQADEGEPRLVAYVSASQKLSADDLRTFVAGWVPEYMIPTFAFVDVLPLTPSGKVDRQALAGLQATEEAAASEYVAPRNDLEREIAGIWQELLGVERVGVTDDFFALGGHSLLATQMITRIRRAHGNVPLRALFNTPTVSGLAEVVGAASEGT